MTAAARELPWRTWEVVQVCVVEELRAMRKVLAATEVRMVGASVLVVYELDPRAAEVTAARLMEDDDDDAEDRAPLRDPTQGTLEDADAADATLENADANADSDSDSDSDSDVPGCGLYAVRLIDLAHSVPAPGRGSDLGAVQGLDTLIGLLVARGDALRAAAVADASRREKLGAAAARDEARRREAGDAAAASLQRLVS